tara:strand:- start:8 stop:205 length:198 start_codon:yes stop_codon:yes gene_type:complete
VLQLFTVEAVAVEVEVLVLVLVEMEVAVVVVHPQPIMQLLVQPTQEAVEEAQTTPKQEKLAVQES